MKKEVFVLVLLLNLAYCLLLLYHPKSDMYKLHQQSTEDIIEKYRNISSDTQSYFDWTFNDMKRTAGYPAILNLFMMSKHWYVMMLVFQCLLGAWLALIIFELIGRWTYLLIILGAFTAYVSILYTDLLFAALFVTAIWQVREKRLWSHFILLGLASIVRPSLAWFFVIEPVVLYSFGYRKTVLWLSPVIAFAVTSFNPINNYIHHGKWIHSNILQHNMTDEHYFGMAETLKEKIDYFILAFKANWLGGHYDWIGRIFNVYKRDVMDLHASRFMWWSNIICVLTNTAIWVRFMIRIIKGKVNYAYVIILIYFVAQSLFGTAGARLRLPIEWILL